MDDQNINSAEKTTLFDRLGGAEAMGTAVDIFYRKMLMDERVSHFFDTTDMDGQIAKQRSFLTMVTGGPNQYNGQNMRDAHKRLVVNGLNDEHVDIVVEHLGATLIELGVADADVAAVAALANSVRDDVLDR